MLARVNRCAVRAGIFLVAVALVAGMAGCGPPVVEIHDWYDLDAVRDNLKGNYILMNDLDSTTPGYEELAGGNGNEGEGWLPIGTEDDAFAGSLDGQGYQIRDLIIYCSGFSHVGVFGFVREGGRIEDIGVVDAYVTGYEVAGGLVGVCYGTVANSYFAANIYGQGCAGGLVGENYGTVTDCYCTGNVTGDRVAGGLVGWNQGMVRNSYATGNVTRGFVFVGGLLGLNDGTVISSYSTCSVTGYGPAIGGLVGGNGYSGPGTVSNSYSTGSVTGEEGVGGLVGDNWPEGTVRDSYATGNVNGEGQVGGLVGGNAGTASNSYSTGNVTGDDRVGGLVGDNHGTVTNSYSTGNVTGDGRVGGLVGDNGGTVSNSFWATETSGQTTSDGGTGKTAAQMKEVATFTGAGWNIGAVGDPDTGNPSYVWNIVGGVTYPFLSWQV
jgi:hypothetical protein